MPAPGQALIDVQFASVTFVETQVRAGHPPHPSMAPHLPVTPGNGVGGVVVAVGTQHDTRLVGARVVAGTGGSGGYARGPSPRSTGWSPSPTRWAWRRRPRCSPTAARRWR